MVRRRAVAAGAFVAASAAGVALGWAAERRAMRGTLPGEDPEWADLRTRIEGRPLRVESFDGTMLSGDVLGDDDAPVLVFAHGFGLSQHVWHYQRRDLTDEFRLVLYDQRGHAGSEPAVSGDYSVDALGKDLNAVIEAAVPPGREVLLVGHSMGGMSVLAYVDQFPEAVGERIAGAIFIDTSGSDVVSGAIVSTGLAAAKTVRNAITTRAFRALGRTARVADRAYSASSDLSYLITRDVGLNHGASPAQVAFVEQLILGCRTEVMAALGPMFTSLDLRDAARLLKVPTLVIVGGKDRLTPPAQARKLADLLPDSRLIEVPDVGHTSFLEAHDVVNRHVREHARRAFGS